MASNNNPGVCTPFAEAVKVEKLDSNAYRVHLYEDFCIGSGTQTTFSMSRLIRSMKRGAFIVCAFP